MATKRYPSLVPAKVVNDAIDGEWCTLTKNTEEDRSIGTIRIPKMSQMNACNEVEDLSEALAKQNLHQLPTSKILDMTPQERLQALEDIHGVMDLPEEDSDVIQTRLLEMDEMLAKLDLRQRIAFDEAVKRNSAYVKRFRLAFLRADAYDATKAAQRMAAHFECRLNLFENSDVLGRDIKLSDLSAWNKDLPLIERGAIQLLKHPDSAGRSIILICSGKYPYAPYHFPSLVSFTLGPCSCLNRSFGAPLISSIHSLGTIHFDVEQYGSTKPRQGGSEEGANRSLGRSWSNSSC